MNPKSNTFCILPWMHVATNPEILSVCCIPTSGENFITDENGAPIKFTKTDEIWNTEVYKNLRKDLLNGKKPKDVCEMLERRSNRHKICT